MGFWHRLIGDRNRAASYAPLYAAIVAQARRPDLYRDGGVADTIDGRFDMVSTTLSLVLLRLERAGVAGREPAARLAELFVDDMDGQLRQSGIGDLVVGKHIGRMMSQLGGRNAAYKSALAAGGDLDAALDRNVHRDDDAPAAARAVLAQKVRALAARIDALPLYDLLAGRLA